MKAPLALLLWLALLVPAAPATPCAFGASNQTTFSIFLPAPHPTYTVWTSAPIAYQLQAFDSDLVSGTLALHTPLAISSTAAIGFSAHAQTDPFTLYLCQDAAHPYWQYVPIAGT
jgi:hypothetical protein